MKKLLMSSLLLFFPIFAFSQSSFWDTYTAALRGDTNAQYKSGVMFEQGIGTDVNQSQAAKWYEKAAIAGHKDAQFNLGIMYAAGRGVEQNTQFALMWLASAAAQGDKEARRLLNDIIDGKLDKKADNAMNKASDNIKPIAFTTKEGARVCDTNGSCEIYKVNTTLTSKRKKGTYYQVSGIGTPSGWKAYEKEGWIEEGSVEIRR
jgi:hypothetical protein